MQAKQINSSSQDLCAFQKKIYDYYHQFGRQFSWRQEITPYRVVVSEVMLQQTQTDRVASKFDAFIKEFPDFESLANAPFDSILRCWKGLGYNRRALALQKIAQRVCSEFGGMLPDDPEVLETFPGIGHATARSVTTFAFNKPTVFIETNIRTVFIYFFFKARCEIGDKELIPLITASIDKDNPREWYYALMDYGVMLKKTVGNLSRLSAQYAKQSRFDGSDRQIRGKILQVLLDVPGASWSMVVESINDSEQRLSKIIAGLVRDGLVCEHDGSFWLVK